MGLNEGLPLLNEGAELVRSEIHTVEVSQAISALDFINPQLNLSVRFLIVVEISERNFKDTTLQAVGGELGSLSAVHKGLSSITLGENVGGLDVIPILAGVGINSLIMDFGWLLVEQVKNKMTKSLHKN